MPTNRYVTHAGVAASLKYRVVWCPKYRRPVLEPLVAARLKAMLAEVADEYGMTIRAADVMPDQVHILVEADPTRSVAEIVNRFKRRTSRALTAEFPSLRSRLPTLWSRSYFAASVGTASDAAIRRYVETQRG